MAPVITLLSDFGQRDPYVGVMKGVITETCPETTLIDLTHQIPPQEIGAAAFWLDRASSYFPEGTVHLAVVDPTVGTERHAVVLSAFEQFFVAPDNGLLTDVLSEAKTTGASTECVVLDRDRFAAAAPPARGTTFHGRDLFAPAAALVASGQPLSALGRMIDPATLVRLEGAPVDGIARIRVSDHYGNLITDTDAAIADKYQLLHEEKPLRWVRTYNDANDGEIVALRGSWGTVEIAVKGGSAQAATGKDIGDTFEVVMV